MKEITKIWNSMNKFYFCNFALVATFILVVIMNFMVQFKVENLQDKIEKNQLEVSSYRDQISMLGVEWAYLTRPARLRELSSRYLTSNSYSLASQIKSIDEMESFYQANYEVEANQELAVNF